MSVPLINPEAVREIANPTPEELLAVMDEENTSRAYVEIEFGMRRFYTQLAFDSFKTNLADSCGTDTPLTATVFILRASGALFLSPYKD